MPKLNLIKTLIKHQKAFDKFKRGLTIPDKENILKLYQKHEPKDLVINDNTGIFSLWDKISIING